VSLCRKLASHGGKQLRSRRIDYKGERMTPRRGYYSVIQYVPNASRMEAVNVGVIIYDADTAKCLWMTEGSFGRVLRFFPKTSMGHLTRALSAMSDRLEIESRDWTWYGDLVQFAAERANALQITPPRWMKLFNPNEVELSAFYRDLVAEEA
jgi:hypothetical protein